MAQESLSWEVANHLIVRIANIDGLKCIIYYWWWRWSCGLVHLIGKGWVVWRAAVMSKTRFHASAIFSSVSYNAIRYHTAERNKGSLLQYPCQGNNAAACRLLLFIKEEGEGKRQPIQCESNRVRYNLKTYLRVDSDRCLSTKYICCVCFLPAIPIYGTNSH